MKTIIKEQKDKCDNLLGKFLDETHYDELITEDTDLFVANRWGEPSEKECIFKFRKNVFSSQQQIGAYDGLVRAATATQNRGLAAGPKSGKLNNRDWVTDYQIAIMDFFINRSNTLSSKTLVDLEEEFKQLSNESSRGIVWLRNKISEEGYTYESFFANKLEEWRVMPPTQAAVDAHRTRTTFISDTTYANQVNSGIAGYYDRYPRIPYGRATSYTQKNEELFSKCFPFMEELSRKFESLLPNRFAAQQEAANKLDPRFRVSGQKTPFTTITVKKNFRTAAHRDAGDLSDGFSNLTVVAKEKEWTGGYLVLPEYRVAIDVRPGDLLLINNHDGIHGNTEIMPPEGKTVEEMERISLVCYFREKMLELGSWEYENHRYEFVESRRKTKNDPKFNGVTEGMWTSDEWYNYLEKNGGEKMLNTYHPERTEKLESNTLAGFFA